MTSGTNTPRTFIVLPSIRPDSLARFVDAWGGKLSPATVLVVEDNASRTFTVPEGWLHVAHDDIDRELGPDAWVVPRKTDCVRSFGILKALELGADVIISLDDDCYPSSSHPDLVGGHLARLAAPTVCETWFSTCTHFKPRGIPYYASARSAPTAISHGLWEEVPDYDAPTQLLSSRVPFQAGWVEGGVPRGQFFPMCGMNVAFTREIAPAFYFLLMGAGHPFDRFGDIWSGILAKRICDHLNLGVQTGSPAIRHARASNVWRNLNKEAAGLEWNEQFWQAVDSTILTGTSVGECYVQLAAGLEKLEHAYFIELAKAMRVWERLTALAMNSREAVTV